MIENHFFPAMSFKPNTDRRGHFDYFFDVLPCDSQHKLETKRRTLSLDKDSVIESKTCVCQYVFNPGL